MGKGMPSCTVLREMLTGAFNQTNLKHKSTVFTRQDTTQYIYQTKHNPLYLPDKRQRSIFTRQNTIHCIYQTRHNTVYFTDNSQHTRYLHFNSILCMKIQKNQNLHFASNKQLQYGIFVHVVFYKNGMIVKPTSNILR